MKIVTITLAIAFSCSPKQIWFPLTMINLQGDSEFLGGDSSNYKFRIKLNGKFHPGTHGLELNCGGDACCDIYYEISKYRISYCVDQPCNCTSTVSVPSKCEDMPLAEFCDPMKGISCEGPYFHEFDEFKGNVSNPGLRGGCNSGGGMDA